MTGGRSCVLAPDHAVGAVDGDYVGFTHAFAPASLPPGQWGKLQRVHQVHSGKSVSADMPVTLSRRLEPPPLPAEER